MKVNTDGVLLGALAGGNGAKNILDIGTGTGVIALMLAQRFAESEIDAVELDRAAGLTALKNLKSSPFARRLNVFSQSFQQYFASNETKRFDIIVSNPPFYIQSLPSADAEKTLAKHADGSFFEELVSSCAKHLADNGLLWLILPLPTAELVKQLATAHGLVLQQRISIKSYLYSDPHREILTFTKYQTEIKEKRFCIYSLPKVYTDEYRELLKDFLTIF